MECKCPSCTSPLVKKNGHIHNGKQNYRRLKCGRQFVLEPVQKIIDDKTKDLIKRVLLDEYLSEGNAQPIGCLYFNEIIGAAAYGNRDAFLFSSPTNPLADILDRIAGKARDPLDGS
jgi:hypothetical protein